MTTVRHFRQILLWPLQLIPPEGHQHVQRPWELLAKSPNNPWVEASGEFHGEAVDSRMRRYTEFTTFLPTVQRFLYGGSQEGGFEEAPVHVFRRTDLARVRVTVRRGGPALELDLARVHLYFFYDINVAVLSVEACADDVPLDTAQELLFRFGRAYPAFWEPDGSGGNCADRVEWLSADGSVVVASDFENQARYLDFFGHHRAAAVSADWMKLLEPLVLHASDEPGPLRYRQLEYLRMPVMAYLALDDPRALTRGDFARLAFATRAGSGLPFSESFLHDFEREYAYDRYWGVDDPLASNTRFLSTGNTFITVGDAASPFFTGQGRGVLGQFRHEYLRLALIAYFHKSALLVFRDQLEQAVSRLDIRDPESIRLFKRDIRMNFEIFLRFTHRYWFDEVSLQAPAKPLFGMWRKHLGTVPLYDEIRREMQDMAQYLDSDGLRRQANTVVRLTVVTTVGLIWTITTGILGMNVIDAAHESVGQRTAYVVVTLVLSALLTVYSIAISKRLYTALELLTNDRLSTRAKLRSMFGRSEAP
jgi:hypothetical protein